MIVQSRADAVAAAEGGADRLEVVRDIRQGGLTPALQTVRDIQAGTSLPLRVMVRENAGYTLRPSERLACRRAVSDLASLGVDGIVIGFARSGEPALDDLARVLDRGPDVRITFHRAFDQLRDPRSALERIASWPAIDRVLTSGGSGAVAIRTARLREYAAWAGPRLTILAGGGVDDEMVAWLARDGSVAEVHVGRAARADNSPDGPVSAARVRELRAAASHPGNERSLLEP